MKKNLNIIQIKGFRGMLYLIFIGCCLAAGFGWFPGWLCMKLWNFAASYAISIPTIGIVQGLLLWGMIAGAYFTFRKDKLVVCMKASEGLSEEELRAVFAGVKEQLNDETFLNKRLKAREAELKVRSLSDANIPFVERDAVKAEEEPVETK